MPNGDVVEVQYTGLGEAYLLIPLDSNQVKRAAKLFSAPKQLTTAKVAH
jgi:hypothetical protein